MNDHIDEWAKKQSDYWTKYYLKWRNQLPWCCPMWKENSWKVLSDVLPTKTGIRLLDYGCSKGNYVPLYLKKKFKVVGADIVKEAVEYCRSDKHKGAEFFEAATPKKLFDQLGRQDEKNTKFDVIVLWSLMQHINSKLWQSFFDAFYNQLAEDGILIIGNRVKETNGLHNDQMRPAPPDIEYWPIDCKEPTLNAYFHIVKCEPIPFHPYSLEYKYFVCRKKLAPNA